MLRAQVIVADLAAVLLFGGIGVIGAWLMRRRTTLTVRNLYAAAAITVAAAAVAAAVRS